MIQSFHEFRTISGRTGADAYIDYILEGVPWRPGRARRRAWEGILHRGLDAYHDLEAKGWAGQFIQRSGTAIAGTPSYNDLPSIPWALQSGIGKKLLRSLLKATYRIALSNGDKYLYGPATYDVLVKNFGISPETISKQTDPRSLGALQKEMNPQVIIFDR